LEGAPPAEKNPFVWLNGDPRRPADIWGSRKALPLFFRKRKLPGAVICDCLVEVREDRLLFMQFRWRIGKGSFALCLMYRQIGLWMDSLRYFHYQKVVNLLVDF
jgi:hypothetical protein